MKDEIKEYQSQHTELYKSYQDLIMRYRAIQRDKFIENYLFKQTQVKSKLIQKDILHTHSHSTFYEDLKKCLVGLFHKYENMSATPCRPPLDQIPKSHVISSMLNQMNQEDVDYDNYDSLPNDEEMNASRVRDHLENTITILNNQFIKNNDKQTMYNRKMIQESIALTKFGLTLIEY